MSEDSPKPSWMNIQEPGAAPSGGQLPPPTPNDPTSAASRSDKRRRRNLVAAIGGAIVVVGATIGIILAASGSRSGTLVDGASGASGATGASGPTAPSTSAIVGAAAAELLAKLPAKSISAGSVQLGPNVAITSMTVSKNSDGSFSGSGTITIARAVGINMNATITDGSNWTLTAASAGGPTIKVGTTGITVDPSTISGTITDVGGTLTWNLTGTTVTWPIANGASLTTNFSIGSTCPFSNSSKCPSGDNVYFGLPKGSLAISGLPTVNLAGGMTVDGSWARLEGTANASASLSVAGASVSMSSPSLTVWRGPRSDSYDANMVMPDTSAINNGTNLEFCGNFAISVPSLVNQATGGCLRWTPNGVILGQVGLGSGMTLSGGSVPSGTTADVKGIGWSTLGAADISKLTLPNGGTAGAISFSGVATKLLPSTLSLGGKANLPGVVTSAIGLGSASTSIDVTGQITSNSIALQGTVPVTINFGTEPFKVSVQQMTLALAAGGGNGFSMSLGTQSDVTLGYGSSARVVHSSLQLTAATAPATGFTLSLSAIGTPGGGDTMDGLTPSTRLAHPSQATFLVPDMMGIGGLNLWSLTGQIGFQGGSPSLAYSSTSYMDPNGSVTKNVMACTSTCDDTDWLLGNLGFDISYTNPCFAYSFTSNPSGGSLAIDGGVMKATSFQVGISPNGCSINAGGTTLSLPKAFAGFAFSATFGKDSSGNDTTVSVATQVSTSGFVFNTSITNLTLGGFTLSNMSLNVNITATSSQVSFDAAMSSGFGALVTHADMGYDSSGMNWNLSGTICTDKTKTYCDPSKLDPSGQSSSSFNAPNGVAGVAGGSQNVGFSMPYFTFSQQGSVGDCATLSGSASGTIIMSGISYKLLGPNDGALLADGVTPFPGSSFSMNCKGIQQANLGISFTHTSSYVSGTATTTVVLAWNGSQFQGSYRVYLARHVHYHVTGHTFDADPTIYIDVSMTISSSSASFSFSGYCQTSRVTGSWTFSMDTDGDFVGSIDVRINIPWGSYRHITFDGM